MDFCACDHLKESPMVLAMASVPVQTWETPYEAATALKQGTVFPSLDLPFYVTGGGQNG